MRRNSFLRALYQHYQAPLEEVFPQFKWGAVIFFWGGLILYGASQLLTPSLQQEIIILIALIVLGVGLLIALMAQTRMLISRILRFFNSP